MGAWNPKAWYTWQGKPTPQPSDAEMWQSCIDNAAAAARRVAELRALYGSLPPGDPRIVGDDKHDPLPLQIRVAESERKHWQEYAGHFRAQVMAQPAVAPPAAPRQLAVVPPFAQARLPYRDDIGDDDGDDTPVWEPPGGEASP